MLTVSLLSSDRAGAMLPGWSEESRQEGMSSGLFAVVVEVTLNCRALTNV